MDARLSSALDNFASKRIMIVGDLMLDEHVWGTVERVSPEAPVMVLQVNTNADCLPGGAANAANNVRALGGRAVMVGVVGDDEGGEILRGVLSKAGVDVSGIFTDPSRPTTRKTRIWASHRHSDRHQVLRLDRESKSAISESIIRSVIDYIRQSAAEVDAILVSDYAKGVVSSEIAKAVAAAGSSGLITVSNLKPCNISSLNGIGVITMNEYEAGAASGIDINAVPDIERAGRSLIEKTGCRGLIVTRGSHGLSAFDRDGSICHVPPVETDVYDPTGAGDTAISALTLALTCGLDLASAAKIANCAGGAVVRKVGVATTSPEEIRSLLAISDL